MTDNLEDHNKAVVREAFDVLFNQRDYERAMQFWAAEYLQHSAHIPQGRDGLFGLVRGLDTMRHETELIVADGDIVLVRGRFSGMPDQPDQIVVDTVRMENGLLKEHWDVMENEATRDASVSGLPMFGDSFPDDL